MACEVAALVQVDEAQAGQGVGLGVTVADLCRGAAGVAVDDDGLGEVTAGVEVAEQGSGQPGGMAGPAMRGGVHGHGDQIGPLGVQPRPRRGQVLNGAAGRSRRPGECWADGRFGGEQGVHRGGRGLQVIVEQAGQRRPLLALVIVDAREVPGSRRAADHAGRIGRVRWSWTRCARASASSPRRATHGRGGRQRSGGMDVRGRGQGAGRPGGTTWPPRRPGAGRTRRTRPGSRCAGLRRRPAGPAAAAGPPALRPVRQGWRPGGRPRAPPRLAAPAAAARTGPRAR